MFSEQAQRSPSLSLNKQNSSIHARYASRQLLLFETLLLFVCVAGVTFIVPVLLPELELFETMFRFFALILRAPAIDTRAVELR